MSTSGQLRLSDLDQPPEVVSDVRQADLGLRPGDADGPDRQRHGLLLDREYVLDWGAVLRAGGIAASDMGWHRHSWAAPAVDIAHKADPVDERLVLLRAICAVGPDAGAGVGRVQEPAPQHPAIVGGGIGDVPSPDQPVATVDAGMRLVSEGRDRDVGKRLAILAHSGLAKLDRPARVRVLLAGLGRLVGPDLGRRLALLDGRLLVLAVALLGRGDERAVDDLPRHGDVPRLAEGGVEPPEQPLDRPGLGEPLPEGPDRLGIGHPVVQAEPDEPHER